MVSFMFTHIIIHTSIIHKYHPQKNAEHNNHMYYFVFLPLKLRIKLNLKYVIICNYINWFYGSVLGKISPEQHLITFLRVACSRCVNWESHTMISLWSLKQNWLRQKKLICWDLCKADYITVMPPFMGSCFIVCWESEAAAIRVQCSTVQIKSFHLHLYLELTNIVTCNLSCDKQAY